MTGLRTSLVQHFSDNPLSLPILIYAGVYVAATITSIDPGLSLFGTTTQLGNNHHLEPDGILSIGFQCDEAVCMWIGWYQLSWWGVCRLPYTGGYSI